MANLTSVGISSGVPNSGTGTVSTIDALMADGGQATIGTKADAKSTATDTTAVTAMSVWKQISASVQAAAASLAGTLTVATHAVTQSGSWVLSAGSALIGIVKVGDGTSTVAVKAASTAPVATDPALVVAISPNSVNANGQATMANSAPVALASDQSAIPTKETRSSTGTQASVSAATSSTSILASNANRLGATVFNDSTAILYLLLKTGGTASTSAYTVQIAAGGYYEVPFDFTGALIGIWSAANGNARVTELT